MTQSLHVLTRSLLCLQILCKYLIFLPISELASVKELDSSLRLAKNTKNTQKTYKSPGDINFQRKQDFICHVKKVKAATLAHSMADVIPLAYLFSSSNPTL